MTWNCWTESINYECLYSINSLRYGNLVKFIKASALIIGAAIKLIIKDSE